MTQRKQWSQREDQFLIKKIKQNQALPESKKLKWGEIADHLNQEINQVMRTGKQCRQRWHNQLDPQILHQGWSKKQQSKLFELQKKIGNKWAAIASQLPGRTDNNVKNYFYSTLRKSLRKVNTFIGINKRQLKGVKQFKQNSLSKLLAVADHKYQNKVNVKTDSVESIAVDDLIQICDTEPSQIKAKSIYMKIVQRLQVFNRNCKKRKGKKRETAEQKLINENISSQQQDQIEQQSVKQEEEQVKPNRNLKNKNNKKQQVKIQERGRSREKNLKLKIKEVNKREQSKKQVIMKKSDSKNQKSQSFSNFENKISLDLQRLQDKKFNQSRILNSNLFKSFSSHNEANSSKQFQNQQNFQNKKTTVRRQPSNSISFFQNIKQVKNKFSKRQSKMSEFQNSQNQDFVNDLDNLDRPLFFTKQSSSFREFPPMQKQLSFKGILDNSTKYQPQMKKLRSYTKQQSYINEYPMNNQDF